MSRKINSAKINSIGITLSGFVIVLLGVLPSIGFFQSWAWHGTTARITSITSDSSLRDTTSGGRVLTSYRYTVSYVYEDSQFVTDVFPNGIAVNSVGDEVRIKVKPGSPELAVLHQQPPQILFLALPVGVLLLLSWPTNFVIAYFTARGK